MAKIQLPTWATRAVIEDDTPADGLAKLNAALGTSLTGDGTEANPVSGLLLDFVAGGGQFSRTEAPEGLAVSGEIANGGLIKLSVVDLIVAVGGDVFGYPVFFEFANASDLDADIPDTFPGPTYKVYADDDDTVGTDTNHTWNTWQPRHAPVGIGDKWYKSSETTQAAIPASCWVGAGLTVKSIKEYKQAQAAAQITP
jgi:hypothetical protein